MGAQFEECRDDFYEECSMSVDIDSPVGFATFEAPDDALPDAIDGAVVDEELAGMVNEFMDLVDNLGIAGALESWTLRTATSAATIYREELLARLVLTRRPDWFSDPAHWEGYNAAVGLLSDSEMVFTIEDDPASDAGDSDDSEQGVSA